MSRIQSLFVAFVTLISIAMFSTATQAMSIAKATKAYGEAWASRDVDRIVALHTEDSTFTLHVEGQKPAIGKAEIREQFLNVLALTPDYASKPYRLDFGPNFVVIMYEILTGPQNPMQMGDETLIPEGDSDYRVDAIDLIVFEDGLVSVKHTFIDVERIRDHSRVVASAPSP